MLQNLSTDLMREEDEVLMQEGMYLRVGVSLIVVIDGMEHMA